MVGKIIRQERIKQKIKSKDLAEAAGIDTGHLSHIEKGIRNPSKTILAKLCNELNLSYQFMLNVAKNSVEEESAAYDVTNYVPYDKVLYAENFKLVNCPKGIHDVSLVTKMQDASMEPIIAKDSTIYVHYTSVLAPNDICLVSYHGNLFVRTFKMKDSQIALSAENKDFEEILIDENDPDFVIIGKIILPD